MVALGTTGSLQYSSASPPNQGQKVNSAKGLWVKDHLISHIGTLVTHLLCRGSQRAPELRQRNRQGKLSQDGWQVMGRELAGELLSQWGVPRANNRGHSAVSCSQQLSGWA